MALNKTNDENNLACLKAMCSQEDAIATCNYLKLSPNNIIDETCRTAMVGWCQAIAMKLNLRPNTLWIAISFFDRYLSSGKGRSRAALQDKYAFQLAAITTFYIAVKLYEDFEFSIDTLYKIIKGFYSKEDILLLEVDILSCLDHRLSIPTPMDFSRLLVMFLPHDIQVSKVDLLDECQRKVAYTSTDMYFTLCKPSVVGSSCLISCLIDMDIMTSTQRRTFYSKVASVVDLIDVIQAQKRLLAKTKCSKSPPSTKKKKKKSSAVSHSKVKVASHSKVKFAVPKSKDESNLGINNILPRAA